MININEAKRLVKRALLANITNTKKDLAITPLISGKHGIGKSQMIKSIADSLNGVCITVEGGSLKEGEITGLPYQYVDENGKTKFRFLPYYAVERIQNEERRIYELSHKEKSFDILLGDENRFANNDISVEEKLKLIKEGTVRPTIIFIDEINRTENTVYKELMNILLTRSVNGYNFPWWVFFVAAMNPSTQNSIYTTNEMDPAQLDRFLKIKVGEDYKQWIKYGQSAGISNDILEFIKANPKCLSSDDNALLDEELASPSPRGWDMVDTILKSEPYLRDFFSEEENNEKVVFSDMRKLTCAKVGNSAGTMFFASGNFINAIPAKTLLEDDEKLSKSKPLIEKMSTTKLIQTCDMLVEYLKSNIEYMMLDKVKYEKQLNVIKAFLAVLDSSTKIRFVQNVVDEKTDSGASLFEYLYEVFDEDVLGSIELSEETKKFIEGKK